MFFFYRGLSFENKITKNDLIKLYDIIGDGNCFLIAKKKNNSMNPFFSLKYYYKICSFNFMIRLMFDHWNAVLTIN